MPTRRQYESSTYIPKPACSPGYAAKEVARVRQYLSDSIPSSQVKAHTLPVQQSLKGAIYVRSVLGDAEPANITHAAVGRMNGGIVNLKPCLEGKGCSGLPECSTANQLLEAHIDSPGAFEQR
jgi:hypothetical protein